MIAMLRETLLDLSLTSCLGSSRTLRRLRQVAVALDNFDLLKASVQTFLSKSLLLCAFGGLRPRAFWRSIY